MDLFTREDLKNLLVERPSPSVSIFLPTHRGGSEADPICWKNLVAEAEQRLISQGMRSCDARDMLAPALKLQAESSFWKNQSDGLAFFLGRDFVRLYRLPRAFVEMVTVGGRFHVKPLIPLLSNDGRYFVLALSKNSVRLLQGTRFAISEVDLQGVPRSLAEALLTHDRDNTLTFHTRPVGSLGSWGAIFSGHGVGIDDSKDDLLLYFQKIDRGLHPLLRNEQVPLILAAVDFVMPIYRKANTYPHLLEEGLAGSPDRLSNKELHERSWDLVQPLFAHKQRKALAQYRQLAGTGRTSCEVEQIVPAAHQGLVETLFVAENQQRWGTFAAVTNQVDVHEAKGDADEDLLNLAAVDTLAHGRTVFSLPEDQMPEAALLACLFFLPLPKRT